MLRPVTVPPPERFYVGVTDRRWFEFLRGESVLEEVNFWSPGGRVISAPRGTPFLFKLKSPLNVIGGGAFVSFVERMSIKDAWEFFGRENGAETLEELRIRIEANRGTPTRVGDAIGCFILSQPFFFQHPIAQPEDWAGSIQGGKYYYMSEGVAQRVWRDVMIALSSGQARIAVSPFGGYSMPGLQPRRLGQRAFRKLVLEAYGRRCAVSGEHTVPVLQASHIKPFSDVEQHEVSNGLALRSDIHTLFDHGYVTVTPDYRFRVSEHLRDDFENGRIYYEYAEERPMILLPTDRSLMPSRDHLAWHVENKFKG